MSRTSDPVQPSRPRPVLLLALAVGAVLVYALQGLVPLLMDGEVPRPDELLAPPSPVVLGGPIAWAAARPAVQRSSRRWGNSREPTSRWWRRGD